MLRTQLPSGCVAALAFSGILLFAPASHAAPQKMAECPAAERNEPTLDSKRLPSARFRVVTEVIGWERDQTGVAWELVLAHGEETADLQDGIRLRVSLGGCETYSNAYEFVVPHSNRSAADGAYWLRMASRLLREVAVANSDTVAPLPAIAVALDRQARNPAAARQLGRTGLESEMPRRNASYRVEIVQRASETTLTVKYWVRL